MPSNLTALEMEKLAELPVYAKRNLELVKGKGALVWDSEGKEYIDCATGIGVALLGHSHPRLARAIAQQAKTLMTSSQSFSSMERAKLEARLSLLFDGKGSADASALTPDSSKVFLCNSGTEAMEAAFKLARSATGRADFVALAGGFHGRTMGALSLTHKESYRKKFEPFGAQVEHVEPGDIGGLKGTVGASTAAVVVEIIQGEGGVRPVPHDFLKAAQDIAKEKGALFIVDEIQTGCGRAGTFFAYEQAGISPDIATLAKGLAGGVPIGAVIAKKECCTLGISEHGSTFGGNPLAAAAANAVLDELFTHKLIEKAAKDGKWCMKQMKKLQKKHPIITEIRGAGLLLGMRLSSPSKPIMQSAQQNGLLALQAGDDVLRLMPPMNIKRSQLAKAFGIIDACLA